MQIDNLSFAFGQQKVLDGISFAIQPDSITTLMGANGCGKTTLLRLMTKNLKPMQGKILLDGQDISQIRLRAFAKQVAIVHQKNNAPDDLTVKKLVGYGRIPHLQPCRGLQAEDHDKVNWALEATGLNGLAQQPMGTLSGGQRQRAFIAMALAQDTEILLLDEPTTYLDVRYQVEVLRLIRELNQTLGLTIIMVLHDINQALAYSDEIIGLKDGRIAVQGRPERVINSDVIEDVYGIRLPVYEQNGLKTVAAV